MKIDTYYYFDAYIKSIEIGRDRPIISYSPHTNVDPKWGYNRLNMWVSSQFLRYLEEN